LRDQRSSAPVSKAQANSGSYQTALPPFECQERLLEALDRDHGDVHVYGTVNPDSFEIHRGTRVRAGAHPVLTGNVIPVQDGARIDYRIGSSKSSQPVFKIAAAVWAIMALSWLVFFVYWIVDRDGIDISMPRLLLLLGIVVIMGLTIAAARRSDERGGAELLELLQAALPPAADPASNDTREEPPPLASDAARGRREEA
jgi:hypothetical protein